MFSQPVFHSDDLDMLHFIYFKVALSQLLLLLNGNCGSNHISQAENSSVISPLSVQIHDFQCNSP